MLLDTLTTLLTKSLLGGLVLLLVTLCYILLPPRYPRGIPAVPFYVTLLPLFFDVDQEETYRRYIQKPLQKHGLVKIFFGGQWNLIIQRPSYLAEMFKNEEIYQKSGNQKKIPHSVLAEFLGDNIISARGDDWRLYRSIIKPGLQGTFEIEPIVENATRLCALLADAQRSVGKENGGVSVQEYIQSYTTANVSRTLLKTEIESLTSKDTSSLTKLQLAVKREIFKPIFMNFPILDRFGAFMPSRARARQLVQKFSDELEARVLKSHDDIVSDIVDVDHESNGPKGECVGSRLIAARDSGMLTQRQFRDNLNVVFVAGQENPQLLLISTLYLLGKYPKIQARLRAEIEHTIPAADRPTHQHLRDMPYLTSVIYESLRLFPPISQLVNRRAASPTLLASSSNQESEIYIPQGTYIGYNCYATNRDTTVWGPTADDFMPERWGATHAEISRLYRSKRARAEFVSFHGGNRACLGEQFAVLEMRVSLCVLVRRFEWRLDSGWRDRKTPAGPLFPRALRLIFTDREMDTTTTSTSTVNHTNNKAMNGV